ncbi:hypothetical protein GCM10022262_40900 [Georgenia daeguensis]|uniref:DUF3027 domain-containing protein n=1 Tax=Georgenia daeguensis TaxID=908355 RepID=A0ABP6UN00_9MICO
MRLLRHRHQAGGAPGSGDHHKEIVSPDGWRGWFADEADSEAEMKEPVGEAASDEAGSAGAGDEDPFRGEEGVTKRCELLLLDLATGGGEFGDNRGQRR